MADEDKGEEGGRVEIIVEQEAKLIEDVRGKEMSFVNDEEREAVFAGQSLQGVA